MEKQIWLVEWTREDLPEHAPAPQLEETVTVDTIATDVTWALFESDYDTVEVMVERTGGGWAISPAPDGDYVDCGGDTFSVRDGELVDGGVVYEDA
jgi:hypothetical protein